jgi:hypothetical protein
MKPQKPTPGTLASLGRRQFLAGGAALATLGPAMATEILLDIDAMQPGEFTWHPDRQPEGPVSVIVSLDQQRVHVYRNGVRIAVSTCSTGKPGHETPTGVFVVLQKDKDHKSSTYNDAAMPNMNRLTWDGIALHAGKLPGYPASHGCVRLPMEFSEKLFTVTHLGTPVIIASSHSDPYEITHPGPILNGFAEQEMEAAIANAGDKLHPKDWTDTAANTFTTVLVSGADGMALVLENDREVDKGRAKITGNGAIGQHVFVLQPEQDGTLTWHAISHHNLSGAPPRADQALLESIVLDRKLADRIADRMHPGMVLILTETSLTPETRSAEDFVILSTDAA